MSLREVNIIFNGLWYQTQLSFNNFYFLKQGIEHYFNSKNFYYHIYDSFSGNNYSLNNEYEYTVFFTHNTNPSIYIFLNYDRSQISNDFQKIFPHIKPSHHSSRIPVLEQRCLQLENERVHMNNKLNYLEKKVNDLSSKMGKNVTSLGSMITIPSLSEKGFTIEPKSITLYTSKISKSTVTSIINIKKLVNGNWNYHYALKADHNKNVLMKKYVFTKEIKDNVYHSINVVFILNAFAKKGGIFNMKMGITYDNKDIFPEEEIQVIVKNDGYNIFDKDGNLRKDIDFKQLPKIDEPVENEESLVNQAAEYFDDIDQNEIRNLIRVYVKLKGNIQEDNMNNFISVMGHCRKY